MAEAGVRSGAGLAPADPAERIQSLRLATFRFLFVGLMALGVFALVGGVVVTPRFAREVVFPIGRLGMPFGSDYHLHLNGPVGPLSAATGVQRYDMIIAVNGKPMPTEFARVREVAKALDAAPGPVVTVTTRSIDGEVSEHRIARDPDLDRRRVAEVVERTGGFRLLLALNTLSAVSWLAAAILLFLRRPRDPVARLMALAFAAMVTNMAPSLPLSAYVPWMALVDPVLSMIAPVLLAAALIAFPSGVPKTWWSWVLGAAALLYGVLAQLSMFDGLGAKTEIAPIVGLSMFALIALTLVLRYLRLGDGVQKQQIRWVLFGVTAAAIIYPFGFAAYLRLGLSEVVLSGSWRAFYVWISNLAPFLVSLLISGGILISLLRYRLYDAETVISRSATIAILTVGLGAVWAGMQQVTQIVIQGTMGEQAGVASAGVAAALSALLIAPAHGRVSRWTERIFQRDLSHLRKDLPMCVGDLRETASLARLLEVALDRICDGVRATRGAVALNDGRGLKITAARMVGVKDAAAWLKGFNPPGKGLWREREDPDFPLRLPLIISSEGPAEVIGWLLLGPRPDGTFYGRDEIDTLVEVADPVARAIHIVQLREKREAAYDKRMADLSAAIADLRGAPA